MKTAKTAQKKKATEYKLLNLYNSEYRQLRAVNFTHNQAVARIREQHSLSGIETLTRLYEKNIRIPGVTGISMRGIKKTEEVKEFIKTHNLTERAGTLYFSKNRKLGRTGPTFDLVFDTEHIHT
jgi:hypothetical protein